MASNTNEPSGESSSYYYAHPLQSSGVPVSASNAHNTGSTDPGLRTPRPMDTGLTTPITMDPGLRTPRNDEKTSEEPFQADAGVPSQAPPAPSSSDNQSHPNHIADPDQPITLDQFRVLMGIPLSLNNTAQKHPTFDPNARGFHFSKISVPQIQFRALELSSVAPTNRPHIVPKWMSRLAGKKDPEAPTSIYYTLMHEEAATWRRYYIYDWIVYGALIVQLILSAALIVIGARPGTLGLAVAIIGAVQGVITGILSIVKGQGMPMRLLRYADGMRKVRESIDWTERELRMGTSLVTLRDAIRLRDAYEKVRDDEIRNHPDMWQTGLQETIKPAGQVQTASGGVLTNPTMQDGSQQQSLMTTGTLKPGGTTNSSPTGNGTSTATASTAKPPV